MTGNCDLDGSRHCCREAHLRLTPLDASHGNERRPVALGIRSPELLRDWPRTEASVPAYVWPQTEAWKKRRRPQPLHPSFSASTEWALSGWRTTAPPFGSSAATTWAKLSSMLLWLASTLIAAERTPPAGVPARPLFEGRHAATGGWVPFRVNGSVIESGAEAPLIRLPARRCCGADPSLSEWQLVDGSVRVQQIRPRYSGLPSVPMPWALPKKTHTPAFAEPRASWRPSGSPRALGPARVARSPMNAGWLQSGDGTGGQPTTGRDCPCLALTSRHRSVFIPKPSARFATAPQAGSTAGAALALVLSRSPCGRGPTRTGTDIIIRPVRDTTSEASRQRPAAPGSGKRLPSLKVARPRRSHPSSGLSVGLQGPDSSVLLVGLNDSIDAPTADGEQILQVDLDGQMLMGITAGRRTGQEAPQCADLKRAAPSRKRKRP